MDGLIESRRASRAIPLVAVSERNLRDVLSRLGKNAGAWAQANGFRGEAASFCALPDAQGRLRQILVGVSQEDDIYALAALPQKLAAGNYCLSAEGLQLDPERAALGWSLGAYRYSRYRKSARAPATLAVAASTLRSLAATLDGVSRVRNLVNTPTEDMGPVELAAEVKSLAQAHGGKYRQWVGEQLLKSNFPTIHAVGRASHRAPRLAELNWGKAGDPQVVIIGKGVCFDTGGLDLKTADGMRWMKKDMGGAAHAIALADMLMCAGLPLRLTLLIPAVENSIAGNALRPGEVIRTRAGITVEIDNTDAEGRLVLCDALAYAVESKPDLIVDFATLTGAARVALGPELPALFSNRDELAAEVLAAGRAQQDQLWQMPLWKPYASMLDSRIADIVNSSASRHAGAITAALYLQRFVPETRPWLHADTYAWNDTDKPGRPQGGEAQGLRAFFAMLKARYARRQDSGVKSRGAT